MIICWQKIFIFYCAKSSTKRVCHHNLVVTNSQSPLISWFQWKPELYILPIYNDNTVSGYNQFYCLGLRFRSICEVIASLSASNLLNACWQSREYQLLGMYCYFSGRATIPQQVMCFYLFIECFFENHYIFMQEAHRRVKSQVFPYRSTRLNPRWSLKLQQTFVLSPGGLHGNGDTVLVPGHWSKPLRP